MARRAHLSGCLSGDFGPCNCEEQVTPTQYKAAIRALGLSQERAGDWLGIGRRTSQGYALGEYPVPEPVAKLLRLVVEIRAIEKATGDAQHSKSIGYLKVLAAVSRC